MTPEQLDRAVGSILGAAAGDALGSAYEFGPPLPSDAEVSFGVGHFGHGVGEWTDDTSMSVPILAALARGGSLDDPAQLATIVDEWIAWAETARDVGSQTRQVLASLKMPTTEAAARAAAREVHERAGRSGGNGSLMRTGPVALGYLGDGREAELVAAAGRTAQLTHWEDDNLDACAIWCLTIRHAIRTGELDVREQLAWIPIERRARWHDLLDEGLHAALDPADFHERNGWVVAAFQGALSAVAGSSSLVEALEAAVRGGGDTDTVAAIAGSLAGARYGASALPDGWRGLLHGWPGIGSDELEKLVRDASKMHSGTEG